MISLISLALSLLESALEAAKANGLAIEIVQGVEGAIQKLREVQGSDVTYGQLEGLRINPKW